MIDNSAIKINMSSIKKKEIVNQNNQNKHIKKKLKKLINIILEENLEKNLGKYEYILIIAKVISNN